MKNLFRIGLILIVLGALSLFIAIPHTEREGISAGGMSVGIQMQHSERVSPIVSGALLLAGAGMIIAGRADVRT
jgi:hypothetical protein